MMQAEAEAKNQPCNTQSNEEINNLLKKTFQTDKALDGKTPNQAIDVDAFVKSNEKGDPSTNATTLNSVSQAGKKKK